jgi:beta-glucosidase
MLHGEPGPSAFFNAAIPRLGIPALTMADGPAGVRVNNPAVNQEEATALPAPIALAATWDPGVARRYGDLIGSEAFATGHNVQLGPAVDIARVPMAGRTFEAYGEDPVTAGGPGGRPG